ncbi:YlqD family protein [Aquibacillus albus]|uniref:YlqD protein n=1 Tax=Aquibacillus albus TaxID=1168171 RepID=A0ABS2N0X2_9BACI|nr:hypothetical protein [Aquibacillus albus]
MNIIQKIPVKQVLTDDSKEKMNQKFCHKKQQLDQECQQLLFEQKKLQNKNGISKQEVYKRFQQEIMRRKEQIKWIEFQLEQLEILPIGSELIEREVEALVEVSEGSNWQELMENKAIIIKDDIVIRIE